MIVTGSPTKSIVSVWARTRPDMSSPATRSPTGSGPCQIPLHGPREFVCTPTRPDPRTKSVHVEIEGTSRRPDKIGGRVGDPSGRLVWSGRVRLVEFRNDTTRPDQRQSLQARLRYELRDAILTCNRKLTGVSLIYRTEPTAKSGKTGKLTSKKRMRPELSVNSRRNPWSQS